MTFIQPGRIRPRIECALIIPLIIQTTGLPPSGSDQIDAAPNVSRADPSGCVQIDAEHSPRNRKVVGSNPTSGSTSSQVRGLLHGDPADVLSGLVGSSPIESDHADDHSDAVLVPSGPDRARRDVTRIAVKRQHTI
jgi:hypothetical protein